MFLLDDCGLPAYFAVNSACWDLVRQFGKRNCAKWKKGMLFSVDERQIRGRKNKHINQNNGTTGQNMQKVKENTVEVEELQVSQQGHHLSQQLI